MNPDPKLKVAEMFYSLQGEGKTIGMPSVFLRLSGCVLACQWCDTVEVWKTGLYYTLQQLWHYFDSQNFSRRLAEGAHLVLTGGDPLMQQDEFVVWVQEASISFYTEVETEGVLLPIPLMESIVGHYNVSPKLANAGMTEKRRLKWDVLAYHAQRPQDIFKFPVATRADAEEALAIIEKLERPVSYRRIYFMPICASRQAHDDVGSKVAELAKEFGVNYSPRLHLQLWDKATGV